MYLHCNCATESLDITLDFRIKTGFKKTEILF